MNNQEREEIKNSIQACKMKLQTIMPHLADDKPMLNETFNKLLIEKAVLRDKLQNENTSFLGRLLKKVQRSNKRELICDYFKA